MGVEALGRTIAANDSVHDQMGQKTKQLLLKSPVADLVVYIGANDNDENGWVGMAPVGVACFPNEQAAKIKDSINEYDNSAAYTGTIVAHEVGHNFGMEHNEDCDGGNGRPVKNGIMNAMAPGGQSPVWTNCDKIEFRQHWRAGCLKGKFQLTLRTWIDILGCEKCLGPTWKIKTNPCRVGRN